MSSSSLYKTHSWVIFLFPLLKLFISYHVSLFVHTGIHIHFLSESSAGQASLMAYSTCPVTVWVAGTKVQNYKKIGDKHATWTFYELHFISIIVTKKGFLLNCKVQNIDHRYKAKSSFFTFYKYFLYLSVCQFAMKARRLHFSSYMFCFVVFFSTGGGKTPSKKRHIVMSTVMFSANFTVKFHCRKKVVCYSLFFEKN